MKAIFLVSILVLISGCSSKLKMMNNCRDTQIDKIWLCEKY